MNSRAQIDGHPLHPILVSFPIALYTATLVFDLLGWFNDADFFRLAAYLEIGAVGTALLAAVPGLIDYLFVVPPNSSAKKRGAKHGLINVAVLLLFGIALYYRLKVWNPNPFVFIGLEGVGFILLLVAGWMGGTLVFRNQIGVVPRYANGGMWKEEYLQVVNGYAEIDGADLGVDQMKLLHIKGRRIVLAKTAEGLQAFDDHCTHKGGSLAGGTLMCGTVHCPWHGSQFNIRDGQAVAGPATKSIGVFTLEHRDGRVRLAVTW